ncbi:hypothetical protein FSP39_013221 [Pinctada imbricata]|uniref:Integrase catalytic domain-containing protein n=1 Tax=Pinctada imbricata TaxID=66713 RepID=A0AA88Y2F9_PINIB|nr:hypothetical protein FSP39_013221 [Pinctada imbricata]
MCQNGLDWNELLPDSKKLDWNLWCNEVQNLKSLKIPRCIKPSNFGPYEYAELHHFSDASNSGYGQCSYLRIVNGTQVHCSFLIGKARVAPLKVVTIPRLELTAAVLSVKMSSFLKRELNIHINKEFFWTDSKVVLGYINNEARRFHVFVANRVQVIRESTDVSQWHYVESNSNPADHASRGLNIKEMNSSTWFTGPRFLWQDKIESESVCTELQLGDPEVKNVRTLNVLSDQSANIVDLFKRVSSWNLLVSVIARIQRFSNGIKGNDSPSVQERQSAENAIVRLLQQDAFRQTLSTFESRKRIPATDKLYRLNPILGDGLLRVGSRITKSNFSSEFNNPIIIPANTHVGKLIIAHAHNETHHQGRGITLNKLRSMGYWLIGGSKAVASFIIDCTICRKLRRPTEHQKMADLPEDRVVPSPPFTYVGMDCFGPFVVKQGRNEIKRYGLLFTCMCSRAIHIEMLDDMSTDCFLNAFRCLIAIRGAVRQIRSDQGSNFVGARNELLKEIDRTKISAYLAKKHCEFVFNAPDASHTGGVWERQIRTVRNILNTVLTLRQGRLDDSSLRTVFYEVMAIVNSRPLTVSEIDNPSSIEPLTPNHLLTAKSDIPLPPPGIFTKEDLYARKRWRRVQYLLEQFWSRWKNEYLAQVSLRQKWHEPRRNIKVGDIVLVKDIDMPRNNWPMARVIEANPDDDGLVRRVKVKVQTGTLERSIHKLVLLVAN